MEIINRKCQQCKNGKMIFCGYSYCSQPLINFHYCDRCNALEKISGAVFPHMRDTRLFYEDAQKQISDLPKVIHLRDKDVTASIGTTAMVIFDGDKWRFMGGRDCV